ncbi:unnamed protein product [Thlaspi arvense]|uniref:Amino acid transporter transmembrane domain-containing protein n=1 Tax=Thlaspi arvense TaxID=13288 RepID=A0AAU9SKL6_THLAR|nr:unnamed protein product [Thlaspi arvense]
MVDGDAEQSIPLLSDTPSSSSTHASISFGGVNFLFISLRFGCEGTVWTATAHVITGVIGSGVLSLAWSVAQLGWIAGPSCLVVFGAIAVFVSFLLCDCYRCPHPEFGQTRNQSYAEAVKSFLGEKSMWVCQAFVQESFYGYGIAYTITAAISMRAIQKSNCYHKEGHSAPCEYGDSLYMLLFGAVQVVVSQIPDFHNMAWLSVTAAIMSFAYSSIGLGLGLAKTIGDGKIKGDIQGVPEPTLMKKVWVDAEAIGDIAFAFTYNIILLEIEVILFLPLKLPTNIAAALSENRQFCTVELSGFVGRRRPISRLDLFDTVIEDTPLVSHEKVYSQPLFAAAEGWITRKLPASGFVSKVYAVKLPMLPVLELSLLRLCFRTAYVASTTGIALLFPYFNDVLGVLGALNFWPLAIYFPVEMFLVQKKIRAWTRMWLVLQAFRVVCLLVTVLALIGSVEGLISSKSS